MLMLHVARGYSLRETFVRAKLANWTDISDVALLKRLRNSEEWLRCLCIELLRENVGYRLEEGISRTIRFVDGTIVREPGKTGSQWRILYSIRLPSLVCDFFEVTATIAEGSGESLNRLRVGPHELILADAGYCSVAGIEYVWHHGTDVLVRVNPQSFVAYSAFGQTYPSFRDYGLGPKRDSSASGALSCMVKVRRLRAACVQCERWGSISPWRNRPESRLSRRNSERFWNSRRSGNRKNFAAQAEAEPRVVGSECRNCDGPSGVPSEPRN